MTYLAVGIAGVIGSLLRHVISTWTQQSVPSTSFPLGTLVVNLIGCFALGWFSRWVLNKSKISPEIRTGITTGLIGSFTTFSAFSVETVRLFREGLWGSGIVYIGLSMIGGLCLSRLGTAIAEGRRRGPRDG